jgi:hypothetical protein
MDGNNHVWANGRIRDRVEQDGCTVILRQCSLCGRDFAQELNGPGWSAAYIGVFKVRFLADHVNERWRKEKCPGRVLLDDEKARMKLAPARRVERIDTAPPMSRSDDAEHLREEDTVLTKCGP